MIPGLLAHMTLMKSMNGLTFLHKYLRKSLEEQIMIDIKKNLRQKPTHYGLHVIS